MQLLSSNNFLCSMSNSCTEEVEDRNMHSETGVPTINELEMKSDPAAVKRKKKARRIRSQRKLFIENEGTTNIILLLPF